MQLDEIRQRIKGVIRRITNLKEERIGDRASFRHDLMLDSLTLMEVGVDVDAEFKLGLGDEELKALDSVEQAAALVAERLKLRAAG